MDDSIKRWTAKLKTALVIEIIQGGTTVSEHSRSVQKHALSHGLSPGQHPGHMP